MHLPSTFFIAIAAAVASSSSSPVDAAMAFRTSTNNYSSKQVVGSSAVPSDGVVRTALYARPRSKQSLSENDSKTVDPTNRPTRASKIDTSSFGRDESLDSYKNEMLNLVYKRSMVRAGLE